MKIQVIAFYATLYIYNQRS